MLVFSKIFVGIESFIQGDANPASPHSPVHAMTFDLCFDVKYCQI